MNPYHNFASSFAGLVAAGKSLPLGGIPPNPKPKPPPNAPAAIIFSPHPDDECLVGGFALRLMRETGMRIINVAITRGALKSRQQARWQELKNACDWLGFELEPSPPDDLERIDLQSRANDPSRWADSAKIVAALLIKHSPRAIFFPHQADWNSTHVGTHFLVMDALNTLPKTFSCRTVETEYWGAMASPNLMVESSVDDVADLLAALSFHVGEVQRNPFHLRMPAWLQDNVRRGTELVGGQGAAAPDFAFATLYRLRQWNNGGLQDIYQGGKQISAAESADGLLNLFR